MLELNIPVKRFQAILIILALASLVSGCAGTAATKPRYFWPRPPDTPRIEWLGAYSSQLDLPITAGRQFKTVIVGEDKPIGFITPIDIKSDGKGRVFVADPGASLVYIYDMARSELRSIPRNRNDVRLRQPISIALDDEGRLYVADRWLGVVLLYKSNEEQLGILNLKKHVGKIAAIAVDKARKRLLAADTKDHKVKVFTLDGEFQFEFGGQGEENGQFNYPIAVTLNQAGEILVADAMNARVQIFDGEGKFLRKFGSRGSGIGDFQLIKGIATDSDGNIYVTDARSHRVLIFNSSGEFLLPLGGMYSIASRKVAPGGFVLPQGLDIDHQDTIYVVDQMNKRFQVFQYLNDDYLRQHPVPRSGSP